MENENKKKYNGKNVIITNLNNYTKPSASSLLTQGNKWILNGSNNSYWYDIEAYYNGSCTNASIIDAYANYIYADGLQFKNSSEKLSKILSKDDARLISRDIKMFGTIAIQVVYTRDRKDIAKLYHVPVKSVAVAKQADITDEPEAYFFCFDWNLQGKFKPEMIPAFGYGEDSPTELYVYRIPSTQPLYSLVDYEAGTQYCKLEEELSNYFITHIQNNFSAGKIINVNQGIPESDEVQEEAERAILNKVQGTSNAGNIVISFNDNKENETTVTNIEITDAYQQFQWLSEQARTMIMLAHKVNDPSLFGLPLPSGFSSVAEQMVQSLKILYRNQINPLREKVLDAMEEIFAYNGKGLQLEYIDFEEIKAPQPTTAPAVNKETEKTTLAKYKLGMSFSYAITDEGKALLNKYKNYKDLYLISSRAENEFMNEFARENGVPVNNVYGMGSIEAKVKKIKELDLNEYLDSDESVINQLPANVGTKVNK